MILELIFHLPILDLISIMKRSYLIGEQRNTGYTVVVNGIKWQLMRSLLTTGHSHLFHTAGYLRTRMLLTISVEQWRPSFLYICKDEI